MPAVHITASHNPGRKRIYFQCQIHAREWISGAACMYITNHLVTEYAANNSLVGHLKWTCVWDGPIPAWRWTAVSVFVQVTSLLDNLEFLVVPFVNPDGYVYTWTQNRMWRKNRRPTRNSACYGVDINRNFPTGWRLVGDNFYNKF